jgi:membrane protein
MRRDGHERHFVRELLTRIRRDRIANGAAALAFYLMLAIFPAAIVLLSLLPYLPIPHLERAIMDLLGQLLPANAAHLFTDTVRHVVSARRGGLLSFSLLFTVWSASNGVFGLMQQLDAIHGARTARPFWKTRATAVLLTALFLPLVVVGFGLVIFGGMLQGWIAAHLGWSPVLLGLFAAFRWVVIASCMVLGVTLVYRFGAGVRSRFRVASPGAVFAVAGLLLASLGFRLYVGNLGRYDATYGSLGAVIVLLIWLYVTGWVLLIGAEINALRGARTSETEPDAPAYLDRGLRERPA